MKFKNAGGAGPNYATMNVRNFCDSTKQSFVEIDVTVEHGDVGDIVLDREQAIKFRDALTVWIKKNEPKQKHSVKMVEGTSI